MAGAWLFLEGDPVGNGVRGKVDREDVDALAAEMAAVPATRRPLLVVLASCRSSGDGDDALAGDGGVLAALGPKLAAGASQRLSPCRATSRCEPSSG